MQVDAEGKQAYSDDEYYTQKTQQGMEKCGLMRWASLLAVHTPQHINNWGWSKILLSSPNSPHSKVHEVAGQFCWNNSKIVNKIRILYRWRSA